MKEYIAKKVSYKLKMEDDVWEKLPAAELTEGWWDLFEKNYKTVARLAHTDDGVILRMESEEWPITIKTMTQNTEVCFDSCMEFFFTPNTLVTDYVNVEASAGSTPLCYVGPDREHRKGLNAIAEGLEFKTMLEFEKGWKLYVYIPFSFMKKHFSEVGKEFKANFYKCGEETVISHFCTWNKVDTPEPDYHRPEFFGKVILSDEMAI